MSNTNRSTYKNPYATSGGDDGGDGVLNGGDTSRHARATAAASVFHQRNDNGVDSDSADENVELRKSLQFDIAQILFELDNKANTSTSRDATKAVTELVYQVLKQAMIPDIYLFGRHRSTSSSSSSSKTSSTTISLNPDDVLLLLRKVMSPEELDGLREQFIPIRAGSMRNTGKQQRQQSERAKTSSTTNVPKRQNVMMKSTHQDLSENNGPLMSSMKRRRSLRDLDELSSGSSSSSDSDDEMNMRTSKTRKKSYNDNDEQEREAKFDVSGTTKTTKQPILDRGTVDPNRRGSNVKNVLRTSTNDSRNRHSDSALSHRTSGSLLKNNNGISNKSFTSKKLSSIDNKKKDPTDIFSDTSDSSSDDDDGVLQLNAGSSKILAAATAAAGGGGGGGTTENMTVDTINHNSSYFNNNNNKKKTNERQNASHGKAQSSGNFTSKRDGNDLDLYDDDDDDDDDNELHLEDPSTASTKPFSLTRRGNKPVLATTSKTKKSSLGRRSTTTKTKTDIYSDLDSDDSSDESSSIDIGNKNSRSNNDDDNDSTNDTDNSLGNDDIGKLSFVEDDQEGDSDDDYYDFDFEKQNNTKSGRADQNDDDRVDFGRGKNRQDETPKESQIMKSLANLPPPGSYAKEDEKDDDDDSISRERYNKDLVDSDDSESLHTVDGDKYVIHPHGVNAKKNVSRPKVFPDDSDEE